MSERVRELAKCVDFDFGLHNGCSPVLTGYFDYEGGSSQGLGWFIDAAFVVRFMAVFGVEKLRQVNGRSCWVTHDHGQTYMIEPLHKKDGRPFDIEEWVEWVKQQPQLTPHELLTGEKP